MLCTLKSGNKSKPQVDAIQAMRETQDIAAMPTFQGPVILFGFVQSLLM